MGLTPAERALLPRLRAGPGPARVAAAARLKHAVVGNGPKKRQYLAAGAAPLLVGGLGLESALATECAAALAALAPVGAAALLRAGALPALAELLPAPAAARALSALARRHPFGLAAAPTLSGIVGLLAHPKEDLAVLPLPVVARTAVDDDGADLLDRLEIPRLLVRLLLRARSGRTIVEVLETLSVVCEASLELARSIVLFDAVPYMKRLLKYGTMEEKLGAAKVISAMLCAGIPGEELTEGLVVVLVELLREKDCQGIDDGAAVVLAKLLNQDRQLGYVAVECGAVHDLVQIVKREDFADHLSVVRALGELAADIEDVRYIVCEAGFLPELVKALAVDDASMNTAAALCIRSVCRSVDAVSGKLSAVPLVDHLLHLTKHPERTVQLSASAALCNVFLALPQGSKPLVDEASRVEVIKLTKSQDEEVRLNSVWALNNLIFRSQPADAAVTAKLLGYSNLLELCRDPCIRVREQALSMVRNLAYPNVVNGQGLFMDNLVLGMGDGLLKLLEDVLVRDECADVTRQALHVIANLASGAQRHKWIIIHCGLAAAVARMLTHENVRIRVAAVWCVTNLSCRVTPNLCSPEDPALCARFLPQCIRVCPCSVRRAQKENSLPPVQLGVCKGSPMTGEPAMDKQILGMLQFKQAEERMNSREHKTRIERLLELGLGKQLEEISCDPDIEVRLRVKEALEKLHPNQESEPVRLTRE